MGLMLTACGGVARESTESGATLPARVSPSSSPGTAATQTASPSSTLQPSPEPSNATPLPTAFGAAIFHDPDDCTNLDVGYRVAYPDSWYSNAAREGIAACWLFAPTEFELVYGTEIPAEVAIVIRRFDEWDSGSFSGRKIISDHSVAVDGLPARVQEIEATERTLSFAPGDRFVEYVIELPDGAHLVATTYIGPDYESAKAVIGDMMSTMQIGLP
jgi:hypothetical protein